MGSSCRWNDEERHVELGETADSARRLHIRHKAHAPISSQITLRLAEGKAPCHQPLTAKPAAPATFIP